MSEELEEGGVVDQLEELGFSRDEALYLEEKAVPVHFASEWHERFPLDSPEELAAFYAWQPEGSASWREASFSVDEAKAWGSCGVDASSAFQLSESGFNPARFREWSELFPEDDPISFRSLVREARPDKMGFSDSLALRVAIGEDVGDAHLWLSSDFNPKEIAQIREAEVWARTALIWRKEIPGCPAKTISILGKLQCLSPENLTAWVKAYPNEPPENIALVASKVGRHRDFELMFTSKPGVEVPQDLQSVTQFLQSAPELPPAPPDVALVAFDDGQCLLAWHIALPDRSPAWIRDFIEESGVPGRIALAWHLTFPDDPASLMARYRDAGVPEDMLIQARSDMPGVDPEEVVSLVRALAEAGGEDESQVWLAALQWKRSFPDQSIEEMVDFLSSSHLGSAKDAMFWRRHKPELSGPGLLGFVEEATGSAPPEAEDIEFVTQWIYDYPSDSAGKIKSYLEAFLDQRDLALEWRAADLDPEEAFSFYDCLFFREPEVALEYKRMGISPAVGGEWDCAFRETDFESHAGLEDWLEAFPEMTIERVYEAAQWFHYGFDAPSEVAGWIRQEIDIFDALLFVACGCSDPEIARAWLDRGFSGPDASRILGDEWVGPSELEAASGVELSLDNAELFSAFRSEGFDPEEAGLWIRSGVVLAAVASKWKEAGFGPASSALWLSVDCPSPQRAREWWDAGATAPRAARLLQKDGLDWYEADPAAYRFHLPNSGFDWETREQRDPDERLN